MTELENYKARVEARNRTFEGFGERHTNAEWSRRLGLSRSVLWRYLQKGLTIEDVARLRGIEYPE